MTKNQIIAKAMLTGLGVWAVYFFIGVFRFTLFPSVKPWLLSLQALLVFAAVWFVVRRLVLNNDSLAYIIPGKEERSEEFDRCDYLVKSFRIAFAILGLLFISSWGTLSSLTRNLQAFSLGNIRLWVNKVIETKTLTGGMFGLQETVLHAVVLFKLAVALYLLFGGVHIVKWHLRNSSFDQKIVEITNE